MVANQVTQVVSILCMPFAKTKDEELIELIQRTMYNYDFIKHLLEDLEFLQGIFFSFTYYDLIFKDEMLELPIGLLTQLLRTRDFAKQFIDYGGLNSKRINSLLKETKPSEVLVNTLIIISQLAR